MPVDKNGREIEEGDLMQCAEGNCELDAVPGDILCSGHGGDASRITGIRERTIRLADGSNLEIAYDSRARLIKIGALMFSDDFFADNPKTQEACYSVKRTGAGPLQFATFMRCLRCNTSQLGERYVAMRQAIEGLSTFNDRDGFCWCDPEEVFRGLMPQGAHSVECQAARAAHNFVR